MQVTPLIYRFAALAAALLTLATLLGLAMPLPAHGASCTPAPAQPRIFHE